MSQPNSQDVHSEVNTLSRNQQTRLTNWLKWSLDGVSIEECGSVSPRQKATA